MRQMPVRSIEMVGQVRAALATFLPSRTEHEMINNQLASPFKEIGQRFFSARPIEHVFLIDSHPWQLATRFAEFVPLTSKLFFPGQQILSRHEPLSFGHNFPTLQLGYFLFGLHLSQLHLGFLWFELFPYS